MNLEIYSDYNSALEYLLSISWLKHLCFTLLWVCVKLSVKSLVTVMYVVGLGPYISGFQPFETQAPIINLVSQSQTTTQIAS